MSESLAQPHPLLKRGDRFLYSYRYQVLGDENLLALSDDTFEVIGWLDEESFADFTAFLEANNLSDTDTFSGIVHQERDANFYMVEFDVDNSRLYRIHITALIKKPNAIS
jgi:hypothetical protein